ncbi:MAG: hypothetical protein R6V06_03885 [Kiritimatiellia bacterium]
MPTDACKKFLKILLFSAIAGAVIGVIFLAYYEIAVKWWAPFALIAIGIFLQGLGIVIEKLFGSLVIRPFIEGQDKHVCR